MVKVLAVIPARGGSKGIPRKNVRLLAGKPLIAHIITAAKKSHQISEFVVTTEDEEIAQVARTYGAHVLDRPPELADDTIPLDPVIHHAVTHLERQEGKRYDYVVTLQPTSPLLSSETIDTAIKQLIESDADTLIAVTDETHLYWVKKESQYRLLQEKRVNRQLLDPMFKETGAILATKREFVTANSRFGETIQLFEMPREESIDIDTYRDWWIAEKLLNQKRIVFRVDGDQKIGLGHIYRTLTLAHQILDHQVIFLIDKHRKMGLEKVAAYNYDIQTFSSEAQMWKILGDIQPHIIINDILDTSKIYISRLRKATNAYIVNFEDLGPGSRSADLTINALYLHPHPPKNHVFGYKYVVLRDEFILSPFKTVTKDVKRILITFGGTDEQDMTRRTLEALNTFKPDAEIRVILGFGYKRAKALQTTLKSLQQNGMKVEVLKDIKTMAQQILDADLVITSNGRTVYEITAIGTPCISISQNKREAKHLFTKICDGILDLGLATQLSQEELTQAIEKLVKNYRERKQMNKIMREFNIRGGTHNTLRLIWDSYAEFEAKKSKQHP